MVINEVLSDLAYDRSQEVLLVSNTEIFFLYQNNSVKSVSVQFQCKYCTKSPVMCTVHILVQHAIRKLLGFVSDFGDFMCILRRYLNLFFNRIPLFVRDFFIA